MPQCVIRRAAAFFFLVMNNLHGFTLLREEDVAECGVHARLYRHDRTGAELLSLSNQDENKVFGITFRTPPRDSTGVAHILEHSVLCGSRKFPVKEPFVELLKGSLQTFLNAFTYPDKTCYPVASQNLKDFYNLIDIYMDAALHPLLARETFDQEAWHYELNNPDEPLIYKGVVFNEMKGVYASAESLLSERSPRVVFPANTYGVDYGGDPRHIPELTWEQLRGFHRKYYHPSNARIYFYGDDDPSERLRLMDEYLREFDRIEVASAIPLHPATPPPEPRVTIPYPATPGENRHHMTINWRMPEGNIPERTLGLYLLDAILTDSPASPLRKALMDSGLGEDIAGCGMETQLREMFFSTGLKGIEPGDIDRVESLILDTLATLARDGIDPKTIEATLNSEEFSFREMNTGSYPRGLSMMLSCLQTWLYEGDPLAPLRYQAPLKAIRDRLARGEPYFEQLIREYLLENPHRCTLTIVPDADMSARLDREEIARLAAEKQQWTPEQIRKTIHNTERLKARQAQVDSPEALRCIPSLKRVDLEHHNKKLPIEVATVGDVPFLFHDLETQGIAYLDLGLNLTVVPDDLLGLVPVWANALLETGTESEDYVALSQRIGRLTGGIENRLYTSANANSEGDASWLFLRGKALDARLPDLIAILDDTLRGARLDLRERVRQIVAEEKAGLEAEVIPAGHRFVAQRLRARYRLGEWIQEQVAGLTYLQTLRRFEQEIEQDWPTALARLQQLHRVLTVRANLLINLTASEQTLPAARAALEDFIARRDPAAAIPASRNWTPANLADPAEALIIPGQVNYVGKGMSLHRADAPVSGHALVVNRYIRSAWLWDRVRVQGGAYGGFSMLDYRSGLMAMVSYRDPNLTATLDVYNQTAGYLRALEFDHEEVDRAVIGAIGDVDSYLLPDAKGYLSMGRHLTGDTEENRQRLRDEILSTTAGHFREFGERLAAFAAEGQVVVMGGETACAALPAARKVSVL